MSQTVSVFCASSPSGPKTDEYMAMARRFGQLLARDGYRCVNGGGDGLMRALSEGVHSEGGEVYCVCLEDYPVSHASHSGTEVHRLLTDRQLAIINRGDAFVALPGGTGTLFEVCEVLAKMALGEIDPNKPLICVGEDWKYIKLHFDHMVRQGLIFGNSTGPLNFVFTVEEAIDLLNRRLR